MKKLNKMESNLIVDSLNYYVANLEKEIKQMEKDGKYSIFAPGFYSMIADELINKIQKDMTKKPKTI
tara:strand:+ start:232 stop:432 length:201 start_codon:yes stop_codon:yes gene_type:complete